MFNIAQAEAQNSKVIEECDYDELLRESAHKLLTLTINIKSDFLYSSLRTSKEVSERKLGEMVKRSTRIPIFTIQTDFFFLPQKMLPAFVLTTRDDKHYSILNLR